MLVTLAVRDIVLIDRLTLSFAQGLCVLTGETGAGKSILLDALGLAMGGRGDSALVRHGAEQASVTAEFQLPSDHPVFDVLREQDVDAGADGTLVLRRVLSVDGRSRCYVNDQPVGVGLLRRLGETLVEVHGQFDTHGLLDPRTHRGLLDAFAGLVPDAERTTAAYRAWRQLEDARARAAEDLVRAEAEQDYLRHAVQELDQLAPEEGEEERLSETRAILQHREKLLEALSQSASELGGDRGAARALLNASKVLGRVADKAGGRIEPILAALDRAADEVAEAERAVQGLSSDFDEGGQSLDRIEERLFDLRAAARKHGVTVDALPALRDDLARRLSLVEGQGDAVQRLAKEAAAARAAYLELATGLSAARRKAAAGLDKDVATELAPLKLGRAVFTTEVVPLPEADWGPHGIDRVQFLVSTNPGAPAGPMNKIASGGELARFTLAIKVVMARTSPVPTLVFDEVDTGIGGAVADAVGERLARLGRTLQVLVVTHSPQVAARGTHHFRVQKREAAGRAVTEVVELPRSERQEEIARMLSGASITEEARAAAARLIESGALAEQGR
ncbi:MAG TPA: DNA repair protein RecN [Azospirillaceae bacterium]|nr:DNA repair protein RecN [Azospirillaceae bacterium]